MNIFIRSAEESDIPRLTEIYNYHVQNGYSTFQTKPKTVEEKMKAFKKFSRTGPYQMLVAERDNKVVGSASSFRYRQDPAFDRTVETGIYIDHEMINTGIGSHLYSSLFEILSKEDLHLAVAGIALPNDGSVALHEKFGFKKVGVFDEYAFVSGKYYSSIWLQKRLN